MTSTSLTHDCSIKAIRYPVPSATRQDVKHIVTEDVATGARSCNCEAGDFAKTRGRCWHLRAINAGLIKPVVRVSQQPTPAPLPTFTHARTSDEGLELASILDV